MADALTRLATIVGAFVVALVLPLALLLLAVGVLRTGPVGLVAVVADAVVGWWCLTTWARRPTQR